MVRRLFVAAYGSVDLAVKQQVSALRGQQEMVDADAVVTLPGTALEIPETVMFGGLVAGAERLGETQV